MISNTETTPSQTFSDLIKCQAPFIGPIYLQAKSSDNFASRRSSERMKAAICWRHDPEDCNHLQTSVKYLPRLQNRMSFILYIHNLVSSILFFFQFNGLLLFLQSNVLWIHIFQLWSWFFTFTFHFLYFLGILSSVLRPRVCVHHMPPLLRSTSMADVATISNEKLEEVQQPDSSITQT